MSYVDISGLIQVQQNYLGNLVTNSSNPGNVAAQISTLNTNLNGLSSSLGNNSAAYVLTGQNTVYDIVQREKSRLNSKKQSVDNALYGKTRLIELNNSYRKRYAQYTRMVVIIVFTLLIILGISYLKNIPAIPSSLLDLLIIIVISVSSIWCLMILFDINYNRDKIYYDEIDTNSPLLIQPNQISKNLKGTTAGSGTTINYGLGNFNGMCMGQNCCPAPLNYDSASSTCVAPCSGNTPNWDSSNNLCIGTCSGGTPFWDSVTASSSVNTCVASCPPGEYSNGQTCIQNVSGFTTIESAYDSGDLRNVDIKGFVVLPFEPSEFDSYKKL